MWEGQFRLIRVPGARRKNRRFPLRYQSDAPQQAETQQLFNHPARGKQDYRCPIQPIQKFVKKLKEMNHPYEFKLEERAGHISAFMKWEESIPLFTRILNYLKKVLA